MRGISGSDAQPLQEQMKRQARRDGTFREENHLLLGLASLVAREGCLHRNVIFGGNVRAIDDPRARRPRAEKRDT